MAFSFGQTAAAAPAQPSSGLFGAPAASTSTSTAFSGFGQQPPAGQQQAAQPGTGLFGSTAAAPAAGGLFGSAGTAAKPSLVVSTPTGSAAPTGGLFGQATQQPQTQPAAGGGLFGSTAAKPAGGLFGSQPAGGGGLFGSTASQQPSTGLFGAQPQAQQPAQQQTSSLFGSTAQPQQQSTGLFGGQQQQSGLFGSTAQKPSMFGAASTAPAFGAPAAPTLGASTLGASALGAPAPTLGASLNMPKQEETIEQRILNIKNAWDVSSPDCRFKYFFYNVVDEGTTQFYGRPVGATDDAKWARAVRDIPDPHTMVPVLAVGWGDVQKRVQAMNQTASVHQQRVKELNEALANLNRKTTLSASVRLATLQAHLQQLTQRLLHLAAMTPSFAPAQSSAFRPEEGEMKHSLEAVKDAVDGRVRAHTSGAGSGKSSVGLAVAPRSQNKGRMLGQINELWGAVEEVRRQRRARGGDGWVGDERMLAELATVLAQQQEALAKLSELANNAVLDADVMRQGLAAVDGGRK